MGDELTRRVAAAVVDLVIAMTLACVTVLLGEAFLFGPTYNLEPELFTDGRAVVYLEMSAGRDYIHRLLRRPGSQIRSHSRQTSHGLEGHPD